MRANQTTAKPRFEPLEAREVPAVGLSLSAAGVLTATGDAADDMIRVSNVGSQVQVQFTNLAGKLSTLSVDASFVTAVVLNGGGGNDYLANNTFLAGTVNGGGGNDYLEGGTGNDGLNGNGGDDILIDNAGGLNRFSGGTGNDLLSSTVAGAVMNGGDGNDLLYDIIGGSTHTGGAGFDNIIANVGDTITDADRTNNTSNDLVTTFGISTARTAIVNRILYINGGDGNDTITIDDAGPNVTVRINGQAVGTFGRASFKGIAVLGGNGDDRIDNNTGDQNAATAVFMVAYGGAGNDDLRGSGAFDFLKGGGGNDLVSARSGGNDFVSGDAGADTLLGDNGAGVTSGRDILLADAQDVQILTDGNDIVTGTFLFEWLNK